ncbi:MAG: hypothetical protein H2060_06760 [Azoarcus sp.]|nr:hypothetical protein [Azoarcus sp.]
MPRLTPAQRIHAICALIVPIVLVLMFAPAFEPAAPRELVPACEKLTHQAHELSATHCRDELVVAGAD